MLPVQREMLSILARYSPLSISVLRDFGSDSIWGNAKELLLAERSLAALGQRLEDVLYQCAGSCPAGPIRGKVVALRRRVHNRVRPSANEWTDDVKNAVAESTTKLVEDWYDLLKRSESNVRQYAERIDQIEIDFEEARLVAASQHPAFQRALTQASPSLAIELEKFGQQRNSTESTRPMKPRTVYGLARYLSRAAAKTSPFSTFTLTSRAVPSSCEEQGFPDSTDVQCIAEVDRWIQEKLFATLIQKDTIRERLTVRINTSLTPSGNRSGWLLLGQRPAESIVTIPGDFNLGRITRLVTPQKTLGQLVENLASGSTTTDQAEEICDRLISLGILELMSPAPDQADRPFHEWATFVRSIKPQSPWLSNMASELSQIDAVSSTRIALGDYQSVRLRQVGVADGLARVAELLNDDLPRGAGLEKICVRESALTAEPVRIDSRILTGNEESLRSVVDWLAIHDRMLPVRVAISEYTKHVYGRKPVNAIVFYSTLQRSLSSLDEQPIWFKNLYPFLRLGTPATGQDLLNAENDELRAIGDLRNRSISLSSKGHLTRLEVSGLCRDFPTWVQRNEPYTVYAQQYRDRLVENGLVINAIGGGYGKGFGRYRRLFRLAGVQFDTRPPTSDVQVAEISGVFGASVNLRDQVSTASIDYPFTAPTGGQGPLTPLNQLHIQYSDTARVSLTTTDGSALRPLNFGMMADPLLPPFARFLVAVMGQSYLLHPSLGILRPPGPDLHTGQHADRVTVDSTVVRRAEFAIDISHIPRRRTHESTGSYVLRMASWSQDKGLPRRNFFRLHMHSADWTDRIFAKSRKPQYVDFASPALVCVLEKAITDFAGQIVFEECLPDTTDPDWPANLSHTTELIFEV